MLKLSYIKSLLTFSFPLLFGNIGYLLIGLGDVYVAAKHGVSSLAAISVANAVIMSVYVAGIGLISGISPIISNLRGAKAKTKKYLLPSIIYSQIIAVLVMLFSFLAIPLIDCLGFEAEQVPLIKEYIFICAFSFFGAYLHNSLKEFLQSFNVTVFPNLLTIFSAILNVLLNFILVFGIGCIPSLGVKGLAFATLITRSFMGLAMLFYVLKTLNIKYYFDKEYLKTIAKISYPMAASLLIEFFAFNFTTILAARISSVHAAVNSIVFTIISTTFMIPLGISMALSIKVGFANGAKNYNDIRNYSIAGCFISALTMLFCTIFYVTGPSFLLKVFSSDVNVIRLGIPILFIAGIFQIFDGLQVSLQGILKGLKMTRTILFTTFVGYWVIAIPLEIYLGVSLNLELVGFWLAFVIALSSMSVIYLFTTMFKFKKIKLLYRREKDAF